MNIHCVVCNLMFNLIVMKLIVKMPNWSNLSTVGRVSCKAVSFSENCQFAPVDRSRIYLFELVAHLTLTKLLIPLTLLGNRLLLSSLHSCCLVFKMSAVFK